VRSEGWRDGPAEEAAIRPASLFGADAFPDKMRDMPGALYQAAGIAAFMVHWLLHHSGLHRVPALR